MTSVRSNTSTVPGEQSCATDPMSVSTASVTCPQPQQRRGQWLPALKAVCLQEDSIDRGDRITPPNLTTQAVAGDGGTVSLNVVLAQVREQATATTDQLEQTTT